MTDASASDITPGNPVSNKKDTASEKFISVFKNLKLTREPKEGGSERQPSFLGHCVLTGVQLILIGGTFLLLNQFASSKVNDWLKSAEVSFPEETEVSSLGAAERSRLEVQFAEIQLRIERHANVMTYFYKQYFISLSMTSGLALVAGIAIFFVSRYGWREANNALINVFIVTSSAALLYGQLPGLFKQDINLEANRRLYLDYTSLRDEVLSYMATGEIIGGDPNNPDVVNPVDSKKFIHAIDRQLAQLNQIPIEFDATRVFGVPDFRRIDPQTGNFVTD